MPASHAQGAYTRSPVDVRAPSKTRTSAATCALDRHASVLSPAHAIASSFGFTTLVVHPGKLLTLPSARPSSASQALSTAPETRARSASLKALPSSGCPLESSWPDALATDAIA